MRFIRQIEAYGTSASDLFLAGGLFMCFNWSLFMYRTNVLSGFIQLLTCSYRIRTYIAIGLAIAGCFVTIYV